MSTIKISNICSDVDVVVGFQKCVMKVSKKKHQTPKKSNYTNVAEHDSI